MGYQKRSIALAALMLIVLTTACTRTDSGGVEYTASGVAATEAMAAQPAENKNTEAVTQQTEQQTEQETETMKENIFYIKVADRTMEAVFENNSSAEAFRELLRKGDVTVSMSDYGDFEKVGSLGSTLPRNDVQITTVPGDVILYQGNSITIYYDVNSWNFTRLGKIEGMTTESMKAFLGDGRIEAVFSLKE